jgi:hypothetical protein
MCASAQIAPKKKLTISRVMRAPSSPEDVRDAGPVVVPPRTLRALFLACIGVAHGMQLFP